MAKAIKYLFPVALILALGACGPGSVASTLTAALSELQGRVDVDPEGAGDFAPAATGSVLGVDGQVQTGDDGRARLDLSTGTIVRVAPASIFTLVSNEELEDGLATRIRLELGQVFVILSGGSLEVETASGVAAVRGSYMHVEIDPLSGEVTITCLEGHCSATNPAGTVEFSAGEKVILFQPDEAAGEWLAPFVETMAAVDYELWLENNPETGELYDRIMDALAELPPPTLLPLEEITLVAPESLPVTLEVTPEDLPTGLPTVLPTELVIPEVTPDAPVTVPEVPKLPKPPKPPKPSGGVPDLPFP